MLDISPALGLIWLMKVVSRKTLREFYEKYRDSESSLEAWFQEVSKAEWQTPDDIKKRYASASIVGGNRVVFNIKGNTYRLVVSVSYTYSAVYIKFVGSHEDYDKIDVETIGD